jgi:hypothetical protein
MRRKHKQPRETWLERALRLRKKAEERLGRTMVALIWANMRVHRAPRRPLEPASLARLRAEDTENR